MRQQSAAPELLLSSSFDVVEATLAFSPQETYVEPYRESLVTFPFVLGESNALGISV
jgi:hypothetical protein